MSAVNPEASRNAQSQAPDTQTLIGLLGGLMPLLQQLQSQASGAAYIAPGGFGQVDPATMFGGLAAPNPVLDHEAAVELIEDINANALRTLSAYLESYANQYAGLASCVAIVTQAARSFSTRDHAQTFALIWQAYRTIALARTQDPQLPPPRVAAQAPQASSSASIRH